MSVFNNLSVDGLQFFFSSLLTQVRLPSKRPGLSYRPRPQEPTLILYFPRFDFLVKMLALPIIPVTSATDSQVGGLFYQSINQRVASDPATAIFPNIAHRGALPRLVPAHRDKSCHLPTLSRHCPHHNNRRDSPSVANHPEVARIYVVTSHEAAGLAYCPER